MWPFVHEARDGYRQVCRTRLQENFAFLGPVDLGGNVATKVCLTAIVAVEKLENLAPARTLDSGLLEDLADLPPFVAILSLHFAATGVRTCPHALDLAKEHVRPERRLRFGEGFRLFMRCRMQQGRERCIRRALTEELFLDFGDPCRRYAAVVFLAGGQASRTEGISCRKPCQDIVDRAMIAIDDVVGLVRNERFVDWKPDAGLARLSREDCKRRLIHTEKLLKVLTPFFSIKRRAGPQAPELW